MSGQIALRSDGICDAAPVFVQVLTVAQRGSSVNKPLELVDRKWFDGSGIMVMRAGWLSRFCPLFLLLLLGKHSSVPQKTFIGVYEADDILCPQAGISNRIDTCNGQSSTHGGCWRISVPRRNTGSRCSLRIV